MFKALVIMGSLAASSGGQLEDEKGPYKTAPECYYRTAQMIKDVSIRIPVVFAIGVCIKIPGVTNGKEI